MVLPEDHCIEKCGLVMITAVFAKTKYHLFKNTAGSCTQGNTILLLVCYKNPEKYVILLLCCLSTAPSME